MHVLVNGEPTDLAALTLAQALRELDLAEAVVATAVNGDFVPVRARPNHVIRDGDRIEVVAPRQGG